MNKLACGIAALGLMAGSVFADYDIVTLGATVTNNPKSAYGGYIALYGSNGVLPSNEKDEYGYVAVDNGYATIKSIVKDADVTTVPDYAAVALSIKNTTEDALPNMGDCSGGFSYEYKGDSHNFELAFDPALCDGTDPDEGSNKWGEKAVAASTTLKTKTITFANLETNGLINTWTGSKCKPATKPALNLKKVLQMSWVIDGGTAAVGKTLTIGTVKCIGGTLPSSSSTAVSSSSTPASTTSSSSVASGGSSSSVAAGSSSSSDAGTSSSSGTGGSSSSGGTDTSSSSGDDTPIISHNNAPVFGLSVTGLARGLQIASDKNATISLFNIKGKLVLSQKVQSGTTTISLANQKVGVYYAVAKSGSQKQIVKIVLR